MKSEVEMKKIKSKSLKDLLLQMTLTGFKIYHKKLSISLEKQVNSPRNLLMTIMKTSVMKSQKSRTKRNKRRKINKRKNLHKKMKLILTLILTKRVTNPSMMTSRIFNPYNNLRRNQFMIYLISEK